MEIHQKKSTLEILTAMDQWLDTRDRWIKGDATHKYQHNGEVYYMRCMTSTACHVSSTSEGFYHRLSDNHEVYKLLALAAYDLRLYPVHQLQYPFQNTKLCPWKWHVQIVNDCETTSFKDVKSVIARAIEYAKNGRDPKKNIAESAL